MSSKPRIVTCKLLNPRTIRRKDCKCIDCGLHYSTRDYKILYKAHKVIYFLYPEGSNKIYCNECLFRKVAEEIKSNEEFVKLLIKDVDGDTSISIEKKS